VTLNGARGASEVLESARLGVSDPLGQHATGNVDLTTVKGPGESLFKQVPAKNRLVGLLELLEGQVLDIREVPRLLSTGQRVFLRAFRALSCGRLRLEQASRALPERLSRLKIVKQPPLWVLCTDLRPGGGLPAPKCQKGFQRLVQCH
jgi:hypothetical protein